MVSIGRRCLFSFLISSAFLLSIAHGDNSTTTQPATTPAFCTPNRCQNGATCNDTTNACYCAPGYSGDTCETENECVTLNNPCQNGGQCADNEDDMGYSCNCTAGYTGANCSTDIDECDSNPCLNGATCNDLVNGYSCSCAEGFNGIHCDTDIRECNSTPCANGATCIDGKGFFNCSCAPGYNGTYCENICPSGTFGEYCVESCTCVDGAYCSNVDGNCTCEPAFDMAACDKKDVSVDASLTPEPPNNTISEYDVFTLACQVNLAEIDLEEFMWTRNDVELPTNNSNPKYWVSRNPDTGMYNITIRNASAEDTGSYVCTAVTAGRQFNASSVPILVNVIVQGQIDRQLSKLEDRIQLNQTASLNCTVFSSSEASIAWERNGMRLENGRNRASIVPGSGEGIGGTYFFSELEISEIVRADNGIYTCLALDAEDNETDRADFTIFVQEVPELANPRITDVLSTQVTLLWDYTVQGNDDDINCTATYSYQVKNEATNGTGEQDVGGTSPSDVINLTPYATYTFNLTCVNLVGRSEPLKFGSVDTQAGKPSPPRNVSVPIDTIEARQVFVQWVEPEIRNGPITSYSIKAINLDGVTEDVIKTIFEGTSTTLEGLTPYEAYKITVVASNGLNDGTFSDDSKPSDPFTTLQAKPGEPDEFDVTESESECIVSWQTPQEPNGEITGYTLYTEIKRRDTGDIVSSQRSDRGVQLGASFMISTLELYSIYRYSVSASTTIGEGPNATSSSLCETPSGGPLLPPALPTPDEGDITQTSFTVALPTYDARNGPVSCYEVIVVRLEDVAAGASLDSSTPTYQPDQIKSYQEARDKTGVPYRAVVFKDRPTSGMLVVGATENNVSTCYTGGSAGSGRRRRRETVAVEDLTAVNGPLEAGGTYSSFVRVYTPSEPDNGMAFYENGPFMSPVVLVKRSNVAAIVGGIFGALIAVCIVGVVVLIFYRRKQNEPNDLLMTPVSNGPRENGNGAIGMQNLGIEDADDMIVKPIRLENLEKAIRQKAQDEKRIFWAEYKALPNRPPPMVTMNNSNLPANKDKNRYINIIAYDHTRVRLKAIDGIEGSDYINASYVNGYQSPDKFIAAQGPKDNTIEDFWRMIWEYDCSTIVMLTKCVEDGKDKCSQYWPNKGAIKYGRFKVKMDSVKETAEYLIRSLLLSEDGKEGGERTITQFHFLGWPDHGQPDYPSPMMCLIKRVRHLTSKMNHRANIVVHCSAGVGRTGTYIVIDAMLDMMKHEKQVDVYNFIHDIRQQRNTLVQSFVQYFFIHMALLEEHLFGHSDVAMSEFPMYYQQLSNKSEFDDDLTKLEVEFRRACKLGVNGVEQRFANIEQNKDKNRIGHILPYDKNVVKLERLIGEEFSDYINASYITGYQRKNMYIATQGPLPNTISDFWRMIWESQTATIVMLTEMSQKGHEMCAQYWPLEMDETEEHGNISVTLVSESDEDDAFTIRDIEISHAKIMQNIYGNVDTRNEESAEGAEGAETDSQSAIYGNVDESAPPTPMKDIRKIRQYHFRGWPEVGVPESGADLMHLVNQSHLHQKEAGPGPIVVHCSAGAGRTGVFIALNILMSRMEEESMIDVFQTVRGLRQQRPHMVQDLAQFKFCYSAMVEYLESQSTEYQNFVARV